MQNTYAIVSPNSGEELSDIMVFYIDGFNFLCVRPLSGLSFIHIKNVKVGSGRSFERCSMLGNVCPDLP
jgi:hypothetical protein